MNRNAFLMAGTVENKKKKKKRNMVKNIFT